MPDFFKRSARDAVRTNDRRVRNTRAAQDENRARPPMVVRLANQWWDRLIGAVFSGSLANQTARYAAHRTTRDYVFNSVGFGAEPDRKSVV